jgi:uncharacterized protein (TIGR03435 family)
MKLVLFFAIAAVAVGQPVRMFESATISHSDGNTGRATIATTPVKLSLQNQTLKDCLRIAYGVKVVQASGNAKWADIERFDIEAKAARPASDKELLVMLQSLLKERFRLDVHKESKMVPGYALLAAKGGVKIHEVEPGAAHVQARRGMINGERISMPNLAEALGEVLNLPVLDMTNTPGVFDFSLIWTADMVRPGQLTADEPDEPTAQPGGLTPASLFGALQEQLGLRLESRKVPVEVMAIDRVERLK